jgi:hypothetical protein
MFSTSGRSVLAPRVDEAAGPEDRRLVHDRDYPS